MNCIIIDPYILAYPTEDKDPINFEDYIDRILDIKNISQISNVKLLISKYTSEILFNENNYPDWGCLKSRLNEIGLSSFIQPRDIMSTIEGLLKLTEIEEFININDILFEDIEYNTSIIEGRNHVYKNELERILILSLLNKEVNENNNLLASVQDLSFVTRGTIVDIDSSSDIKIVLPDEICGEIIAFKSQDGMMTSLDPIELWRDSETKADYMNSINIYIFQRTGVFRDDYNFDFGDVFFEKAKHTGFLHEIPKIKSLLKSLSDTILGENLPATHALRKDEGGNSPQVTRGEEKAWRRDIDYEYHLHYWQDKHNVEFASLGVHNDMKIPG